jgi:hypothetical protein
MLAAVSEDLGPYWQGDTPTGGFTVEFVDADRDVQDLPSGTITATLLDPSSAPEPVALPLAALEDGTTLAVAWPAGLALTQPGTWRVVFRRDGARLSVLRFVVQADDGWMSLEDARREWADAPQDDAVLADILASARLTCETYASPLGVGALPPPNYRVAQLMQARAVWNSVRSDSAADTFGPEGFTVRVYPLDANVRQQLKPRPGRPIVR